MIARKLILAHEPAVAEMPASDQHEDQQQNGGASGCSGKNSFRSVEFLRPMRSFLAKTMMNPASPPAVMNT